MKMRYLKEISRYRPSGRGSILILLLWVLLFLSTIAIGLSSMVRQAIHVMEKVETRDRLRDIAASGVYLAMDAVNSSSEAESPQRPSIFSDFWFDDSSRFDKIKIGDDATVTVSYVYADNVNGVTDTKYGVVDEERKINVNNASKELLENILLVTGDGDGVKAGELAGAIIDWRDSDDLMSGLEHGVSESVAYNNDSRSYTPSNAKFRTPEELLLVKGMDLETFTKVRDFITIFGDGKININTAPKQVLLSLGLSEDLANKVIFYRAGPDNTEGTSDDTAFSAVDAISNELSGYCDLSKQEKDCLKALISKGVFTVRSNNFTVTAISELKNNSLHGKLMCVFDRNANIKYWSYR